MLLIIVILLEHVISLTVIVIINISYTYRCLVAKGTRE